MSSSDVTSTNGVKAPPKHIAIVMDGNGRWAKSRGLPRPSGHQKGVKSVRTIVKHCAKIGVNTLTLFAFSSENMKRPSKEVGLLFKLFLTVLRNETKKLKDNNIKLDIIGDLSVFTPEIQNLAKKTQQLLQNNTGLNLVIAANYGGQWDIAEAAKKVAAKAAKGEINPESIDNKVFSVHIALAQYPRVDLLIRTGGEFRISNFLLWQLAYTELYFCEVLWPEFSEDDFVEALNWYATQQRRFGKTQE